MKSPRKSRALRKPANVSWSKWTEIRNSPPIWDLPGSEQLSLSTFSEMVMVDVTMADEVQSSLYEPRRVDAIKAIRAIAKMDLIEAALFIAETFGFPEGGGDKFYGWRAFMKWQDEHQISLDSVQGPHAITILKAIAAKHASTSR